MRTSLGVAERDETVRWMEIAVGVLCLAMLGTWLPHYWAWPMSNDLDTLATTALAWDGGEVPYRDFLTYQFPGQIYLSWLIGKAFGWGRVAPFYVFDALLLVVLGVSLCVWSRRRLGRMLPGLVGYATFLAYYLNLPFGDVLQRDWHAALFAVLGLLVLQAFPAQRLSFWLSALLMALSIAFRPQAVLFLPAAALAVAGHWQPAVRLRDPGAWRAVIGWCMALGVCIFLVFLPLIAQGIMGDFLNSIRHSSYGGGYSQLSASKFLSLVIQQLTKFRLVAVSALIVLLATRASPVERRLAMTWVVAFAFVFFYRPLSPRQFSYHMHPMTLVWAVNISILTHLMVGALAGADRIRVATVGLILALGLSGKPQYCSIRSSWTGIERLVGWTDGDVMDFSVGPADQQRWPWQDYRLLLDHLSRTTNKSTRVANLLADTYAVNAPLGRLPLLPSDIGFAWLTLDRGEPRLLAALGTYSDSVIVWDPSKFPYGAQIRDEIEKRFEPTAHFGLIQVWSRIGRLPAGSR